MYDWETAMMACPTGWHLPSDEEWFNLESFIDSTIVDPASMDWRGTDAGIKLKSTFNWRNGGNGNDNFSFRALPGGWYDLNNVVFMDQGKYGFWWTSTETSPNEALRRGLSFDNDNINRITYSKTRVYSVRCIED